MSKTLDDVLWELEYADKLDRKHAKKFVKVDGFSGADTLEDERTRIFYADMCDALHAKATINFRTTMSLESAKFILIALARAVLGKSTVKSIMQDCGVSFEDYGRRKACEKFIADRTKPIIKLRGKYRGD